MGFDMIIFAIDIIQIGFKLMVVILKSQWATKRLIATGQKYD